jgi:hypothetical protein
MRRWIGIAAFVCVLCALGVQPLAAAGPSKAEVLVAASAEAEKIFSRPAVKDLYTKLDAMKEVGLFYDASLTVPHNLPFAKMSKQDVCTYWGMLAIDVSYALLFNKNIEAILRTAAEADESIGWDSRKVSELTLSLKREEKVSQAIAFNKAVARMAATNPDAAEFLVNALYGSALELFYIFAKLGIASGITTDYLRFVNDHLLQLQMTKEITGLYTAHPELAQLFDTKAKQATMDALIGVLTASKGQLKEADLQRILSIVQAVRDPILAAKR